MPRPATRRRGLVAALATVAVLSACTGNTDDRAESTPTPAVAATAAASTADTTLKSAVAALADTSPTGEAAREAVFTGPALESANAWAKTLPGKTPAQKADAQLSTSGAEVIGVSRVGDEPKQLLVETTLEKSQAAVLALLVGDEAGQEFKVAALTPMLTEARVDELDATSIGSEAIGSGEGLAITPEEASQSLADSLSYPEPEETTALVEDPFSAQLRQSAAAQAKAISASGTFTQSHEPKDVLGGLRLKDGSGAIVFTHLVRTDSIAMRQPTKLKPSKDLTLLTGIKQITSEASLESNQIVALVIPTAGAARVVAAWDQLVGGTGR
ncbi:hypothetical protein [Intrasporangium sp.]|uniref:hypothetical protein n=1 Tax=Intrasporangium sp. TaxID=1925024 RepID=UPI002B4AA6D0|nr:hypothetical protein [Intrasporangium sp.]